MAGRPSDVACCKQFALSAGGAGYTYFVQFLEILELLVFKNNVN